MIYPVILCGGSGTRLWPLSRKTYPKQFLDLLGSDSSLLQATALRLQGQSNVAAPTVVCNIENRFLVAQQLKEIGVEPAAILLEPEGRNTAPAIAAAAVHILQQDREAVMVVLPSDHVIENLSVFHAAIEEAERAAAEGALVTFGITPTHAETGYGYIKKVAGSASAASAIERFVEKPDAATAESYLAEGSYLWNSGMFVFSAAAYLEELANQRPEIAEHSRAAIDKARRDLDFICLDEESFAACPSDSIDYAVMENASSRMVVDLDAGWSDLGSWSSLWDVGAKDADNSVLQGDVLALDSSNNYVKASDRLVATLGVEGLVIVDTEDAVLVADRNQVQDVKAVVESLNSQGRSEAKAHNTVYRPWGAYTSICNGERFQVKRIVVEPGQKLSLQKHHHRAEHWIVVSGIARVTCEDRVFDLSEDQSTYIPLGDKHRLENPGRIPLELIEVQSGSYLGEDDIVRYDDVYGRDEK